MALRDLTEYLFPCENAAAAPSTSISPAATIDDLFMKKGLCVVVSLCPAAGRQESVDFRFFFI